MFSCELSVWSWNRLEQTDWVILPFLRDSLGPWSSQKHINDFFENTDLDGNIYLRLYNICTFFCFPISAEDLWVFKGCLQSQHSCKVQRVLLEAGWCCQNIYRVWKCWIGTKKENTQHALGPLMWITLVKKGLWIYRAPSLGRWFM